MPFITAFFLPRTEPIARRSEQFPESTRDCIFTTEYSVRTGMEAVYQLLTSTAESPKSSDPSMTSAS